MSIYTFTERTKKTKSVVQAYEHAATVIRAKFGVTRRVIFGWDAFDRKRDSDPTMTLEEFDRRVERIVAEFADCCY